MALSRKNRRKLNRLRKDADRLWSEQQAVFGKARDLAGRAGGQAKDYADKEVIPVVRRNIDDNIRPAFERGVGQGRRLLSNVSEKVSKHVVPAVAQAGGNVAGAARQFVDKSDTLQSISSHTQDLGEHASKKSKKLQRQLGKEYKKLENLMSKQQKSCPGVGGWFLIGAGVAALAAVGYALWQTFRSDDDLWIADEELDAPVKTVTNN